MPLLLDHTNIDALTPQNLMIPSCAKTLTSPPAHDVGTKAKGESRKEEFVKLMGGLFGRTNMLLNLLLHHNPGLRKQTSQKKRLLGEI